MTHDVWRSFKSHCAPVVSYTIDHPPEIRPYDSGLVNQLVSLTKTLRCGEGGVGCPGMKKTSRAGSWNVPVHHLAIPVKTWPLQWLSSWPSNDPGDQVGSRIESAGITWRLFFFQRSSVQAKTQTCGRWSMTSWLVNDGILLFFFRVVFMFHSHRLATWWFHVFLIFTPYLGKWSTLTIIFEMGWNHQLATVLIQLALKQKKSRFGSLHNPYAPCMEYLWIFFLHLAWIYCKCR